MDSSELCQGNKMIDAWNKRFLTGTTRKAEAPYT